MEDGIRNRNKSNRIDEDDQASGTPTKYGAKSAAVRADRVHHSSQMPRVKHFWVILTLCTLLLFLYLRVRSLHTPRLYSCHIFHSQASRPEHLNPQSPRQSVHSDTIHISADSKKQQAVITAFKVRLLTPILLCAD